MAKKTRIVFGVTDLIAFRVVCEECGGEEASSFSAHLPPMHPTGVLGATTSGKWVNNRIG